MEEFEKTEEKKEKFKSWLKNRDNLYFLGVMIFAIVIRLYYFFMTNQQTLWWDEAEYMSISKNLAFNTPYDISPQRLILFPALASLIFKLGLGELAVRFILVLLPSILVVYVTYLFVKEMYNAKIAALTALITSVCWIHLFYSMRVQNDEIGFLFGLLAMFFFWKGYVSGKNNKLVYLSAFLIGLSFLIRPTGVFYALILILFLFITEQFKFLLKPQLWAMPVIFFLTLLPHLIWSYFYHGNPLAFRTAYGGPDITIGGFGWHLLNFVYDYPELVFFIFFIIGLITLLPMVLSLDKLFKGSKRYQNDLLMLITIIFIEAFSIFVLWDAENRWLVAMSLGIFVFASKGILFVFNIVRKNLGKTIAIIALILILVSGIYVQLKHTDMIIKVKLDSYQPVQEAGLWLKENSNPDDVVFSRSWPQNTYYSERETFTFDAYGTDERNVTDLVNVLKEKQPRFYIMSIFEPHGQWMMIIPQNNQQYFTPVQVYYAAENQPILVIYEINPEFYSSI